MNQELLDSIDMDMQLLGREFRTLRHKYTNLAIHADSSAKMEKDEPTRQQLLSRATTYKKVADDLLKVMVTYGV